MEEPGKEPKIEGQIKIKGPERYIHSRNVFVEYTNTTDIVFATLRIQDQNYDLRENSISLSLRDDGNIYIYHSYKYFNNNVMVSGRWYNTHIKKEEMGLIFEYRMENYELQRQIVEASIRIEFTEKCSRRIFKVFDL